DHVTTAWVRRHILREYDDLTRGHDPATGLPDRMLLSDRLERAIAHALRRRMALGVGCFSIDRFLTLVETLGSRGGRPSGRPRPPVHRDGARRGHDRVPGRRALR